MIGEKIRHYISNRWCNKTHTLQSNLPRGQWYDLDQRILHCVFDELVNFVEVEAASFYCVCNPDAQKKYGMGFFKRRCRRAGLDYLDFQEKTSSNKAAKIVRDLYLWWTCERPHKLQYINALYTSDKETDHTEAFRLSLDMDREDTEKLIQLIQSKYILWT